MKAFARFANRRFPILSLACALAANAQEPPRAAGPPPGKEQLDYAIEWRLIPAGTAKISWTPIARPSAAAGEIRLRLESAGLVSRLFRVEDDYTSLLGQNLCAQSSFLSAREGNRHKETRVVFDSGARKASWSERDFVKNSVSNKDAEIPPCVHDVLGALLLLRTLRVEPGKTVTVPVSDGKKFVQAKIEAQAREEIKTDFGTLKTIRYEAFLFNNVLYKRSGHLHIWLTDDDKRLPVQLQIRLQLTIGTITLRLKNGETPKPAPNENPESTR